MPTLTLQIDPAQVLGVGPEASLQEIRDAYRAKAKRYHPDSGGEDWAFRILVQAYEALSTARVVRATDREAAAPPRSYRQPAPPPPPPPPPPRGDFGPRAEPRPAPESVRRGVTEEARDPSRVVDVEKLSVRYPPDHVWLVTDHNRDDRLLSCSLNLTWPPPDLPTPPADVPDHGPTLKALEAAFAAVAGATAAREASSAVVEGRFTGWLSYPSTDRATYAFEALREALHAAGLSVHQWSRDLTVPRQRR